MKFRSNHTAARRIILVLLQCLLISYLPAQAILPSIYGQSAFFVKGDTVVVLNRHQSHGNIQKLQINPVRWGLLRQAKFKSVTNIVCEASELDSALAVSPETTFWYDSLDYRIYVYDSIVASTLPLAKNHVYTKKRLLYEGGIAYLTRDSLLADQHFNYFRNDHHQFFRIVDGSGSSIDADFFIEGGQLFLLESDLLGGHDLWTRVRIIFPGRRTGKTMDR